MATLATLHLALVVGLVGFVAYAKAVVDCNKHLRYSSVRNCCKISDRNYSTYTKQCPAIKNERVPSPCTLDCIFNVTNAFKGDQLNMPNVRLMMSTLLNNDPALAAAFNVGFEKCMPLITQKLAEMKANGQLPEVKLPGLKNCQLLAMQYVMCAHKYVFTTSCPAGSWTETPECAHAKEYMSKCSDERPPGFGIKRGSGRGNRKARIQAEPV